MSRVTPRPFRVRLALAFAALISALLLVADLGVYYAVSQALWSNFDEALINLARTEGSSALDEPGVEVHVHASGVERYAVVFAEDGAVLAQSDNVAAAVVDRLDRVRPRTLPDGPRLLNNGDLRAVFLPVRLINGRLILVSVAVSTTELRGTLARLRDVLIWSLVLAVVMGVMLSVWLASRLTRPLETIAGSLEGIDARGLELSVPESVQDQEIAVLQAALKGMLGRLKRALEEQDRAIARQRQFVADASHELRTPLGGVLGTLEVALRRERSAEEYRRSMEVALEETRRLVQLVGDLLALSRQDLNRNELKPAPVDLQELLAEVAAAYAARAQELGVQLAVDAEPIRRELDRAAMRQILDNLVDNALRYAPSGSAVELRAESHAGRARLAILDRGPGVVAEQREAIFERFARADPARSRGQGGFGLGLAIARSLVTAHQGRIWVEERSDGGAAFYLEV